MNWILKIVDFLFPVSCTECGQVDILSKKIGICRKCIPKQVPIPDNLCEICATPLLENSCGYCESRNVFFDKLFFINPTGVFEKKILNKIKFGNEMILSNYFRLGIGRILKKIQFNEFNYLTLIPSHKNTLRKRPISQSFSILKILEKRSKFCLKNDLLLKKNSADLQSKKSYRERFLYAKKAYSIEKKFIHNLRGNAILIDDIFTTGASVNECSKILKENGVEKVYLIVFVKSISNDFFT
ncbi:MAG: double zinc ribbon domain-containing protein [Leptospiraceae bacterium]|nr:ComF family protein [Leptospiraceae bacterium]MCK6379791.1 double zinc ribbon domain-containing protein [Leptospiraceae bacterium]NUM41354.1 ComF family protein [Leptospiraceae bacterium]